MVKLFHSGLCAGPWPLGARNSSEHIERSCQREAKEKTLSIDEDLFGAYCSWILCSCAAEDAYATVNALDVYATVNAGLALAPSSMS